MRSVFATLRALVLPAGAGTGARIVVGSGSDIPADLTAQYAGLASPETITGGLIFFRGGGSSAYFYLIDTTTLGGGSRLCLGVRDGAGDIGEIWNYFEVGTGIGGGTWGRFSTTLSTLIGNTFINNNLQLDGSGTFQPQFKFVNGASLSLADTCFLSLVNSAIIDLQNTSMIHLRTGTTLQLDSGSLFTIDGRTAPRGWLQGANITTGNMTAAVSAETDAPTAALNVNVTSGQAYMMHLVCRANLSDMTQAYEVRVRRDTALTGTQIGVYQMTNVGSAAAGVWPVVISLPWLSAATENLKLFFSVIRTSAAGTIQLIGSPGGVVERAWKGFEHVGDTVLWTTA